MRIVKRYKARADISALALKGLNPSKGVDFFDKCTLIPEFDSSKLYNFGTKFFLDHKKFSAVSLDIELTFF